MIEPPDSAIKYDVAFSFRVQDLGRAKELVDGLSPLRMFVYER